MEFDVDINAQRATVRLTVNELASMVAALNLASWESRTKVLSLKYESMHDEIVNAISEATKEQS